jgi:Mannosyl-glycoprotein endo-beta-N-acetylglucosaminidase.
MSRFINLFFHKKFIFVFLPFIVISCQTMPTAIISKPRLNSVQLTAFLMYMNPELDQQRVMKISSIYIEESEAESINSDIAFAQMCLETGFLSFKGLVKEDMNNFCGLGAIDINNTGITFENEILGIRAHIQHLKAYASKIPLKNECVDPRYKYVNPKGKATKIKHLAGRWASDPEYSNKIQNILNRMYLFSR